jgi:hypothetical protein
MVMYGMSPIMNVVASDSLACSSVDVGCANLRCLSVYRFGCLIAARRILLLAVSVGKSSNSVRIHSIAHNCVRLCLLMMDLCLVGWTRMCEQVDFDFNWTHRYFHVTSVSSLSLSIHTLMTRLPLCLSSLQIVLFRSMSLASTNSFVSTQQQQTLRLSHPYSTAKSYWFLTYLKYILNVNYVHAVSFTICISF